MVLERNWKKRGGKGKIWINGESIDAALFSSFMLEQLNMPVIKFPKGNPQEERNWSELSWRMILRHIYRQERFWGDIADKQPPSEQRAALFLLLGVAERLYSPEFEELVIKRGERQKLVQERSAFVELFNSIYTRILEDEGI